MLLRATRYCLGALGLIALLFSATATCGGRVSGDGGTDGACGQSAPCGGQSVCMVTCTGLPFYCDAPDDAGACAPGYHRTLQGCFHGPGANVDGGGCSNLVDSYECVNLPPDGRIVCPYGNVAVVSNGIASCCMD